jgi:uncharacterized phage-associated protein
LFGFIAEGLRCREERAMFTATQIADWIVRFRAEAGVPVDPMSLQKLLYYVQAFHLARHGEPLFANGFEAWKYGPVLPKIWQRYKDSPTPLLPQGVDETTQLPSGIEDELRDTVGFFSRMTPFELSETTHKEDPWIEARGGLNAHAPSTEPIPDDKIRVYYAGLLWDGEEALSRQEVLDDIPEPRVASFYRAGICVRGMKSHPLYHPLWAEGLCRPVPAGPELPDWLYEPIKRRNFMRARDL